MSRRVALTTLALLVAVSAASCGRKPQPKIDRGYNCIGFADDIKTLRKGDELPRVVQVLGMPSKAYRAFGIFGPVYDVLEYNAGVNPCVKALLHSKKGNVQVVFDGQGRYVGYGDAAFAGFRKATVISRQALVIDPVVFKP